MIYDTKVIYYFYTIKIVIRFKNSSKYLYSLLLITYINL